MPATNFTAIGLGGQATAASTDLDIGYAGCYQGQVFVQNSTTAVSKTFKLPKNSEILSFLVDVTTAYDSVTSAVLTIGTAAAGTQYVTSVDVKAAAGRIAVTFTGAQLLAMENITTNTTLVATVTVVGATTAGRMKLLVHYIPGNN